MHAIDKLTVTIAPIIIILSLLFALFIRGIKWKCELSRVGDRTTVIQRISYV